MALALEETGGISSAVDDLLRRLYVLGLNWLVVEDQENRWVLHKERLIGYIGMGLADNPIIEVLVKRGKSLLDDPVGIEDQKVLFISREQSSVRLWNEIFKSVPDFPSWWEIPLPVVRVYRDRLDCNEEALRLFPGIGISPEDMKILVEKGEFLFSLDGKRQLFLHRMKGPYFIVEDIGGDISMAEDVGWWCAVGKALVERLRREEYNVERVASSPLERSRDDSEFLPCGWEGQLLGYLKVYKKR